MLLKDFNIKETKKLSLIGVDVIRNDYSKSEDILTEDNKTIKTHDTNSSSKSCMQEKNEEPMTNSISYAEKVYNKHKKKNSEFLLETFNYWNAIFADDNELRESELIDRLILHDKDSYQSKTVALNRIFNDAYKGYLRVSKTSSHVWTIVKLNNDSTVANSNA